MKTTSVARNQRRMKKKQIKKEQTNILKTNKCWDELELLHGATVGLFFSTKEIVPILKDEKLMSLMEDRQDIENTAECIAKDISSLKDNLIAINAKHRGKTGGTRNEDQLLEAAMIGQEYIDVAETFNSIVTPNIMKIAECAQVAINKHESNNAEPETKTEVPLEDVKGDTTDV